jgi:hypothetical protein
MGETGVRRSHFRSGQPLGDDDRDQAEQREQYQVHSHEQWLSSRREGRSGGRPHDEQRMRGMIAVGAIISGANPILYGGPRGARDSRALPAGAFARAGQSDIWQSRLGRRRTGDDA